MRQHGGRFDAAMLQQAGMVETRVGEGGDIRMNPFQIAQNPRITSAARAGKPLLSVRVPAILFKDDTPQHVGWENL